MSEWIAAGVAVGYVLGWFISEARWRNRMSKILDKLVSIEQQLAEKGGGDV